MAALSCFRATVKYMTGVASSQEKGERNSMRLESLDGTGEPMITIAGYESPDDLSQAGTHTGWRST
jgi:hypothetical protein